MAGRFDIQRYPQGLLDVFNMKVGGDTPQLLSPEIRGTVEVGPLYAAYIRQQAVLQNLSVGAGFNSASVVPAGEIWMIVSSGLTLTTVLGTTMKVALAYQCGTSGSSPVIGLTPYQAAGAAAAQTYLLGYNPNWGQLILQPGWRFGAHLTEVSGGTHIIGGWLDYYRLTL